MTGLLIALEGIDGSGKSTQLARYAQHLRDARHEVVVVREPGGTRLGEQLRDVLLDPRTGDIAPAAEALLYAASRAELVSTVIRPALERGAIVLADRFVGSSLAYQGAGRGLGIDRVAAANELALDGLRPHATLLVRVTVDEGAARRDAGREAADDRIESAGRAFLETVAHAYDELAAADPVQWLVVDGSRSADDVEVEVRLALAPLVARAPTIPPTSTTAVPEGAS